MDGLLSSIYFVSQVKRQWEKQGFSSGKLGWGFSGNIKKPLRRSYNWWFLLTYLLRITNIYTYSQLLIEGLNADRHPDGDWSFPSCILQMTELWHRYLAVLMLLSNSLNLISTSFCEARSWKFCWINVFISRLARGLLKDPNLRGSNPSSIHVNQLAIWWLERNKRYLSRCGNSPRPCKCLEDSNSRAIFCL